MTARVAARLIRGFALAALGLLSGLPNKPAIAARPFVTDDADVIEARNCEVEIAHTQQRAQAVETERLASAQLACGVGLRTELGVAGARVARGTEHWPAFALAGKTGLRRVADGELGLAVAYSILGERLPGSDFKATRESAMLVATESRLPVLLHANLGFTHDRSAGKSTTLWALAVERTGERIGFGAEAFGENARSAWLGAGARYAVVADRVIVDTAFAARSNSSRARRATIGLTFAF